MGAGRETTPAGPSPRVVYRHRAVTRAWHWINLACLVFLLGSGLQIFNAYPRLHWGQAGADADPAALEIVAEPAGERMRGLVKAGKLSVPTTGVLGVSKADGVDQPRGFPAWVTIPSYPDLATGRRVHFFFAWLFVVGGAVYAVHTVASRHLSRDLLPTRDELRPRRLLRETWEHLLLKTHKGEAALRYNPLQKIAYLAVLGLLLPLMVLTGLTMTPGMDAAWPVLLDLFGGRQSARTLHFITAGLILLFVAVHVFQVILIGPVRSIRAMITGWWIVGEKGR